MTVQDDALAPADSPAPEVPQVPLIGIPAIEEADFIDQLAERTAAKLAKLAEGLLRLPPVIRGALAKIQPSGFYLAPTSCGYGPDRFELRAFARPSGIELAVHDSAGNRVWWAVLL